MPLEELYRRRDELLLELTQIEPEANEHEWLADTNANLDAREAEAEENIVSDDEEDEESEEEPAQEDEESEEEVPELADNLVELGTADIWNRTECSAGF